MVVIEVYAVIKYTSTLDIQVICRLCFRFILFKNIQFYDRHPFDANMQTLHG